MLHVDPTQRLSASQLVNHPWLRTARESPAVPLAALGANSPADIARVKETVEAAFQALNPQVEVTLAPVTKSSLASRRGFNGGKKTLST